MNYNYIHPTLGKKSELAVETLVNQIIKSGKMSPKDHFLLTSSAFQNDKINEQERRQINRIFDYIQTGRLELVHW